MTRPQLHERLVGVIAPALSPLGVNLWGLELASSGGRTVVRIYVDAEDGPDVDRCAEVSRHLGIVLDAEADLLPGAYVLEVSSPGLERRFFSLEQMAAYIGREVDIRLQTLHEGRRHLHGALVEAGSDHVVVNEDGAQVRVPWEVVKTARLVHDFSKGTGRG